MPCQHSHIDLDERVSDGLRVRALQSMQLVTLLGVDGMNPRQRQAMLAAGVYLPPPQHVIGTVGEHTVTLDLRAMTYYCSACPAFQHEDIGYHLLAVWVVAR